MLNHLSDLSLSVSTFKSGTTGHSNINSVSTFGTNEAEQKIECNSGEKRNFRVTRTKIKDAIVVVQKLV
jgi:hypothetical protein